MDVNIDKTFKNVGERFKAVDGFRSAEGLPRGRIMLLLHWPASWDDLDVVVEKVVPSAPAERFRDDLPSAVALLKTYRLDRESVPGPIAAGGSRLRVAELGPEDNVRLKITILTDAANFCRDADAARQQGRLLSRTIQYVAVPSAPAEGRGRPIDGMVRITLPDAGPMKKYGGFAAIDFGTSGSTMACIDDAGVVEVISLEGGSGAAATRAIDSAVLFENYKAPESEDQMEWVQWLIGGKARRPLGTTDVVSEGLVLGPKRILVDVEINKKLDVQIGGRHYPIRKDLPAELFLCRLFRIFHELKKQVPRNVVVTCPTTYSHWEAERLERCVRQAWRRSVGAVSRAYNDKEWADLPRQILDEASAGAFYLIAIDHIQRPGGLDVFQSLYPEGLNLLVCDYGGGTTDIALVHARAEIRATKGERGYRLSIQVIGRTGHRAFGGDDMTLAVFRVLKAKLATRLRQARDFRYPEDPSALREFLRDREAEIDQAVPTRFAPDADEVDDIKARKALTMQLWGWAERVKRQLSLEPSTRAFEVAGEDLIAIRGWLAGLHNVDEEEIRGHIEAITVGREEVDVQIREALNRSIDNANLMVHKKAATGELPGGEVHSVYIIGNASLYPLVGEQVRKRLAVRFIDHRTRPIAARDDLKNAVAKGAALATQIGRGEFQYLDLDFDSRRVDRLPYDITVPDLRKGGRDNTGHRVLFAEHTPYDALPDPPPSITVPDFEDTREKNDRHVLQLFRRWPGEDERPEPFLKFRFKKPIQGPSISVWFDARWRNFVMRDEGTREVVEGASLPTALYRAPEQSGKI